jgi:hypothetical protein
MPLVTELSAELRRWLTPQKLGTFNGGWRSRGGGWSDETIAMINALFGNRDLHYEQIIGAIEVDFARERDTKKRQELYAVHGFLLQAVRGFLHERQMKNLTFALSVMDDFVGLRRFVEHNKPLWIFTTNHDVNIEMLAAKLAIPLKSGFKERLAISMNSGMPGARQIQFERLPRASIKANDFDFFRTGEFGINLIKLHGSLDIFGQNDELNYVKIAIHDGRPESYVEGLDALQAVDFELGKKDGVRAINEHCYIDTAGELQFLRNSVLSGAHKFSPQMSQIAPPEFLSLFRGSLNFASHLICIGYGFADQHLNDPIAAWLAQSAERQLAIVNPNISGCPAPLGHLFRQVSTITQGAREYFLSVEGCQDTSVMRSLVRQLQIRNRHKRMEELLRDYGPTGS